MKTIIKTDDVVKKHGDFLALDHISFQIEQNTIFGFLGPNGAGKSTTIKILTTILKPDAGSIEIDGYDPIINPFEVRKRIGVVFQDLTLDNELTALENLELHAALYNVPVSKKKQMIKAMLEFVDLWDKRNLYVRYFSGGMKRRLEIARAFLHEPKILFLDEPTLGLDPQTRNHIWGYIKTLVEEQALTVFFTTHYMEEADRFADKIAIIDRGKILDCDVPYKIKEKTNSKSLEDAFIMLTGQSIREEKGSELDQMKDHANLMNKKWK